MNVEREIKETERRLKDLKKRQQERPQGTAVSPMDVLRYLVGKPEKERCTTRVMAAFSMSYPTFVERMYLALGRGWVTRERKNNMVVWTITEKGKEKMKEE